MNNKMVRGLSTAGVLAMGIALSGCLAGTMPSPEMASAKVPVVQQTMLVYDLSGSDSLSGDQRRSLGEWFDSIGVNYGDRISIDDGGSAARRAAVSDVLSNYGLLLSDNVPVTAGGSGARVIVMRATASVPGCPDWSRRSNPEFDASKMSNYGCANAGNLAAMVVDANDLVAGKQHTGTDALTTVKAIETYRNRAGQATSTVRSTVGQVSGN